MKRIFHITRNELWSLFFSPIAWLLLALFLVLTAVDYFNVLERYMGYFERGGQVLWFVQNLTDTITSSPMDGYFPKIIDNLYIFVPLITMGLISREISSGTIRLLYSSPIRITEVVLGKYLAMVIFSGALMALVVFTFAGLSASLSQPDYGHMIAALGGLFLVLATYAAIGLFISALTSYQIVAAIVTFAVFAFISRVGGLWQDVDLLRNVTGYLDLGKKSGQLLKGLYNLRDVCYFLIIITSFLAFTIIRLRSAMQSVSPWVKAGRYAIVVAVACFFGYLTNKPSANVYADVTRDQVHTITRPTQAMLAKLNDGPLEITVYGNLLSPYMYYFQPSRQNFIKTSVWEPYVRFKPDINFRFVYYYDVDSGSYHYKNNPGKTLEQIAENQTKSYKLSMKRFLGPEEIRKQVDVVAEEYRSFFRITYQGKSTILRVFNDIPFWPSENEIAAAINRLVGTPPKVAFLSDQIERGPFSERTRDYKMIASQLGNRLALINQGYDFDTLSLRRDDIPDDLAALVIADPRTPFTGDALAKIQRYIDGGGNLLLSTEPDRKAVTQPVLDMLGLSLRDGLLLQPSDEYASDMVFSYLTDTAKRLSPQFHHTLQNEIKYYGDTLFRVALAGASVLEYNEKYGFQIEPLLTTDALSSWNRIAPIETDSLQTKVASRPDDERDSFTTGVLLKRTVGDKKQRIIVISDADYLTGSQLFGRNPTRYNYDFGFWSFSQFTYGQFPANTLRPQTDDSFDIKVADIGVQRMLLLYILPALIVLLGSIILIRRKGK